MATSSPQAIVFAAPSLPAGAAHVRRLSFREGMSAPYEAELEIELPDPTIEPRAWLLEDVMIGVLTTEDGEIVRRLAGVVMKVRERASRAQKQRILVSVEAPLSRLKLVTDYRIFQEMTAKDIIAALLDEVGIPAARIDWRLQGSYTPREVTTQLGETSFAFMSRILEEDGIFYFFEHGEDGATIVFGDSSSAYAAVPGDEIAFVDASGLSAGAAVTAITEIERVRPGKVTLRDHDFKRPSLDLEAKAEDDAPLGIEHYDYPGRYTEPGEGKRRATLRLDALRNAGKGAFIEGTAGALVPGHAFTLSGSPDPSLDKDWVVVDLETTWDDAAGADQRYRTRARIVEKGESYRPPHRTPRAVFPGPQLATVTGPAGDEIHTDEHGRIKVHFPWDRRSKKDDKSSAWVRVGQLHTSGSVAIPRVGWEVIVDFEDGDPDKPVAMGRLYNALYRPPGGLPGTKTVSSLQSKSTPGGTGRNEISMDDAGGAESVSIHAQKDWNLNVANDKTEKVTSNASLGVGADETIKVGANETLKVGGGHEISVGASQTWSVGGSRTETVTGAEKITVGGSRTMTIGGSHTTMTPRSVSESTPATISETIGGSAVEAAALGVGMAVAGAASFTIGGAKIAACATGLSAMTLGAQATTIGGALVQTSGADVTVEVKGAKATTVGGAFNATAAANMELSTDAALNITVGAAVALNATSITLKVGGSTVTIAEGGVTIKSTSIKLTATGPQPELAPMVEDK